jgi:hypothetical protein
VQHHPHGPEARKCGVRLERKGKVRVAAQLGSKHQTGRLVRLKRACASYQKAKIKSKEKRAQEERKAKREVRTTARK